MGRNNKMKSSKTPQAMLTLNKVNTFYGPVQALRDVSITLNKGEIVTIIGANGAGKSTLLNTCFAKPQATSGEILYDGKNITNNHTADIAKSGISLVPEGRRIFPAMTVEENLYMGCIHLDEKDISPLLDSVYKMFPFLAERKNQRGGTLSGGEQQMLAIGRALMSKPICMLLDEPSLGLAPLIVKRIFEKLKEISSQGITILLVEQNASLALQLADRAYVLANGAIALTGTGQELLTNEEVKKSYLGG